MKASVCQNWMNSNDNVKWKQKFAIDCLLWKLSMVKIFAIDRCTLARNRFQPKCHLGSGHSERSTLLATFNRHFFHAAFHPPSVAISSIKSESVQTLFLNIATFEMHFLCAQKCIDTNDAFRFLSFSFSFSFFVLLSNPLSTDKWLDFISSVFILNYYSFRCGLWFVHVSLFILYSLLCRLVSLLVHFHTFCAALSITFIVRVQRKSRKRNRATGDIHSFGLEAFDVFTRKVCQWIEVALALLLHFQTCLPFTTHFRILFFDHTLSYWLASNRFPVRARYLSHVLSPSTNKMR